MKNTKNLSAQLSNSDSEFLKSALFLELIGQEPIIINRAFVDLTGNVLSALWLTYAMERERRSESEDFFEILMSSSCCTKDTGITRAQQQTCRKTLVDLGILHEQAGQGRIITYRISKRRLLELLQQQALPFASAMRSAATTSVAAAAH